MAVSLHIEEAHQPLPPALLTPALSGRGFHKKLGGLNQPFTTRAWEEDDPGVTSGSSTAKDRCHTLSAAFPSIHKYFGIQLPSHTFFSSQLR